MRRYQNAICQLKTANSPRAVFVPRGINLFHRKKLGDRRRTYAPTPLRLSCCIYSRALLRAGSTTIYNESSSHFEDSARSCSNFVLSPARILHSSRLFSPRDSPLSLVFSYIRTLLKYERFRIFPIGVRVRARRVPFLKIPFSSRTLTMLNKAKIFARKTHFNNIKNLPIAMEHYVRRV